MSDLLALFQLPIIKNEKIRIFSIEEANSLIPKVLMLISRHKQLIEALGIKEPTTAWELAINSVNDEKIRQTANFIAGQRWIETISKLYAFLRPELREDEAYINAFEIASELSSIYTMYHLFEYADISQRIRNPFAPLIEIIELGAIPMGLKQINYKEKFVVEFPSIISSIPTFLVYIEGNGKVLHYRKANSKQIEELPANLVY